MRCRRVLVASPLGEHASTVDDPVRERRARQLHQGRQDVDRHGRGAADRARWNHLRVPNDHRYANPPLERRPLRFPQAAGRPRVIAVVDPRAVVAGEEHDRVVENPVPFERFVDLTHRPVDLADDIRIGTVHRALSEFRADSERHMRHRMRDVEEERPIGVPIDEVHRALREIPRHPILSIQIVDVPDRTVVSVDRQSRPRLRRFRMTRPHIVRIGDAVVLVEPLSRGKKGLEMTQMPLPEAGRRVAAILEHLGDGDLIGVESMPSARHQGSMDSKPVGVASGEERRPSRRTHRLTGVEIGEPNPFGGESIDVRCEDLGRPLAGEIPPPLVVGEHHDDVRWFRRRLVTGRPDQRQGQQGRFERERRRSSDSMHGRIVGHSMGRGPAGRPSSDDRISRACPREGNRRQRSRPSRLRFSSHSARSRLLSLSSGFPLRIDSISRRVNCMAPVL